MGYQSAATEAGIVALRDAVLDPQWTEAVVDLVRRTRAHPDIRVGSSVRGAIDMVGIADRLGAARGVAPTDWHTGLDAALVSLSGRVRMLESCVRTPEEVVRELYEAVFGTEPSGEQDDGGTESPPGEA